MRSRHAFPHRLAVALPTFLLACAPLAPARLPAQEELREETVQERQARWPESRSRTVEAVPVEGEIRVDGRLDEEAWFRAAPATGFVQEEPFEGEPAMEDTEVRVLFDDESVYVGALLHDSDPSRIARQLTRRDETGRAADYLEFSFDPNRDLTTGYTFRVTAAGVQRDEYDYDDTRSDRAWDGIWEAECWGVSFARRRIADNERSAWAWTPRGVHGNVSRWGRLEGVVLPRGARNVELLPYSMAGAERVSGQVENPFFEPTRTTARAGTDLRVGLGSTFVLDAALNPDFGQVEVDPRVIDLSAFETFFPERRPFFTRDDRLFDFGLSGRQNNLFYSRRIGRSPQGGAPDGADFVDEPRETTILGTSKITGRTAGGLTLGGLLASTAREVGRAWFVEDDEEVRYVVEPRSWYGTFRAQQEFRDAQSRVGGIITGVERELPGEGSLDVLPGRAYTGGLDFEHSWADREWALWGFAAGSLVEGTSEALLRLQISPNHYYQRPDQDYLELDSATTSLSGLEWRLQFERQSGEHWTGAVWAAQRTPGFEVNDMGFSRSTERLDGGARIQYAERQPGDVFQSYRVSASTFHNWRHSALDDPFSASAWNRAHKAGRFSLDTGFTFRNWWSVGIDLSLEPEVLSDVLTRGGPLMVDPGFRGVEVDWRTDRRDALSLGASVGWEDGTRGGGEISLGLDVDYRPTSGLSLNLGPSWSRSTNPVQYVVSVRDPDFEPTFGHRYLFAEIHREEISLDTRLDLILSPDLSVQLFTQPLLSAGDFVDYRQLARPSSFDFIAFPRGEAVQGADGELRCEGGRLCERDGRLHLDHDGDGRPDASFPERNFTVRSLRGSAVLRWEYRPGSRIYLAWQQRRQNREALGNLRPGRDLDALFSAPGEHFFMIKVDYWLGL